MSERAGFTQADATLLREVAAGIEEAGYNSNGGWGIPSAHDIARRDALLDLADRIAAATLQPKDET